MTGCGHCDGECGSAATYGGQACLPINGKVRCIDWCIHQIVAALNAGGVETITSCCGHGKQDGSIVLVDGRELIVRKSSVVKKTSPCDESFKSGTFDGMKCYRPKGHPGPHVSRGMYVSPDELEAALDDSFRVVERRGPNGLPICGVCGQEWVKQGDEQIVHNCPAYVPTIGPAYIPKT